MNRGYTSLVIFTEATPVCTCILDQTFSASCYQLFLLLFLWRGISPNMGKQTYFLPVDKGKFMRMSKPGSGRLESLLQLFPVVAVTRIHFKHLPLSPSHTSFPHTHPPTLPTPVIYCLWCNRSKTFYKTSNWHKNWYQMESVIYMENYL